MKVLQKLGILVCVLLVLAGIALGQSRQPLSQAAQTIKTPSTKAPASLTGKGPLLSSLFDHIVLNCPGKSYS
jgi:hypothetical protein